MKKSEKRQLLDKIADRNERIRGLENQVNAQASELYDLRAKFELSVARLAAIAEGSYWPHECNNADEVTRPKITAAQGLKKLVLK